MHAETSFLNGSGASMKWRETTENMSFGPKVVDWACSLLENKKRFWRQLGMFVARKQETVPEAKTRALNAPRYCKKTRNGSRAINSCIKSASIPVFATCQVRLRNGMEPPKT